MVALLMIMTREDDYVYSFSSGVFSFIQSFSICSQLKVACMLMRLSPTGTILRWASAFHKLGDGLPLTKRDHPFLYVRRVVVVLDAGDDYVVVL